MNFDEAILAHSDWKRKIKSYLQKPDRSLQPAEVGADNKCKLGQWITGEERKYAAVPEFTRLVTEHARFHRAAGELVRRANHGEKVDSEVAVGASSEFAKATSNVIASLLEMKSKV